MNQAQNNRDITGNSANLLSAFLPFTSHSLQRRNCHGEQLHDNRGVNVRGDTHSKQSCLCKSTTGHHVHVTQESALLFHGLHQRPQSLCVQERNGDNRTEPEHNDNQQGKQNLLAKVRDFPSVLNGVEQLRSPQLSRLQLRFSLSQQQRKRSPSRSGFCSAYHWTGSSRHRKRSLPDQHR